MATPARSSPKSFVLEVQSHGQKNVSAYYFWRTFFACDADGQTALAFCQRDAFRIQPDVYALRLQDFAHSLGNVFVFPSNQARSHLQNRDFAPEAAIDLGELQPNITSADDDEIARARNRCPSAEMSW